MRRRIAVVCALCARMGCSLFRGGVFGVFKSGSTSFTCFDFGPCLPIRAPSIEEATGCSFVDLRPRLAALRGVLDNLSLIHI